MSSDDDTFAALAAGLDLAEPVDVVDFTKLDSIEIAKQFHDVRRELYNLGEMHGEPKTQRGRELHSQRSALLIEMSRRRLR